MRNAISEKQVKKKLNQVRQNKIQHREIYSNVHPWLNNLTQSLKGRNNQGKSKLIVKNIDNDRNIDNNRYH